MDIQFPPSISFGNNSRDSVPREKASSKSNRDSPRWMAYLFTTTGKKAQEWQYIILIKALGTQMNVYQNVVKNLDYRVYRD
jgi:hypothetical protein